MSNMQKVKILVAGAGLIGSRHIELIQGSPHCELSAIVDPAAGVEELARNAGVPRYQSLGDALAAEHPAGVILATPNRLHLEGALACIHAGIPVLVEKPLTPTAEEGRRLCAAAEQAGVRVLVGHHRRHSPILERACRIVREGMLGRIVAIQGSALFYKPDTYFDEAPWRRMAGGGPILINLVHEVDNLRSLCGEITAVQAFASSAARGFPVEDTVAISLRFAGGALGSFLLSDAASSPKSWEQTSLENASYAAYSDEDCYVIAGTNGSLAVPSMRLKTYARNEDRSWWKPFQEAVIGIERADPLARQLDHFCAVIRGEVQPLVTAYDGLQNVRVIEAVVAAARTGQTVDLE